MFIGHVSDLHGNLNPLYATSRMPDVWVFTGDNVDNDSSSPVYDSEVREQTWWLNEVADRFIARLGGKPVVCVDGNHDYVDMAAFLRSKGVEAYNVADGPVDLLGERFAGYRNIPRISGVWQGETFSADFPAIVEKMMAQDPTIVVVHAPPAGILDDDRGCGHGHGVTSLTSALCKYGHRVKACLYGHVHRQGGRQQTEMDILFANGACCVRFHEVP